MIVNILDLAFFSHRYTGKMYYSYLIYQIRNGSGSEWLSLLRMGIEAIVLAMIGAQAW